MSRSRTFLGGLVLGYGYQAAMLVSGIWLTPFLLNHVGQHDYGLWLVGTQLLTYLTLTDFGVVALLPLETASATGRAGGAERAKDLPGIIGQTARLVLYQLPLVAAIAGAMWLTIPPEWQSLRGPLAIVLFGFVATFPLRIFPALLHGLQDLSFTGGIQILGWALSTAVTVAMVLAGWSLFALALGWLISQILLAPFFLYRLWNRFPGVLPRRLPRLDWSAARTQLGKGSWVSVAQVAQLLMSNTDLLIIGNLLGPGAVVPYACTGKLASVLANQAQILMQTATPGLVEMRSGESRQRLLKVLIALTHGILTFSGLVFCIVVLANQWFVTWWVTEKQYGGFLLAAVILLNMLVRHWNTTAAYAVFCFGHQRRISLTNLFDGLVTALVGIGLTMYWGPAGVPLGSLVGVCLVSLPFNLRVIARDTDVTVMVLIREMLERWIWRFAVVGGVALWVTLRWSPRTLPEVVAATASVGVLYALIMLPNMMRPPLGDYLWPILGPLRQKYMALQVRVSS